MMAKELGPCNDVLPTTTTTTTTTTCQVQYGVHWSVLLQAAAVRRRAHPSGLSASNLTYLSCQHHQLLHQHHQPSQQFTASITHYGCTNEPMVHLALEQGVYRGSSLRLCLSQYYGIGCPAIHLSIHRAVSEGTDAPAFGKQFEGLGPCVSISKCSEDKGEGIVCFVKARALLQSTSSTLYQVSQDDRSSDSIQSHGGCICRLPLIIGYGSNRNEETLLCLIAHKLCVGGAKTHSGRAIASPSKQASQK
ncbi:hypothetical protein LY76DRAFT_34045 [Colletotrichum caudatum]|nr:hypothetical protein LY76DRAFT_34045 [Colletotrichum caudatum]